MRIEGTEAWALDLDPKAGAQLTGRLLKSLELPSYEANESLRAEEAERCDAGRDAA